jgi:hypothetical protein
MGWLTCRGSGPSLMCRISMFIRPAGEDFEGNQADFGHVDRPAHPLPADHEAPDGESARIVATNDVRRPCPISAPVRRFQASAKSSGVGSFIVATAAPTAGDAISYGLEVERVRRPARVAGCHRE